MELPTSDSYLFCFMLPYFSPPEVADDRSIN